MRHGVIQGYFIGGARLAPPTSAAGAPVQRFAGDGQKPMPGPPPSSFSSNAAGAVQRHAAPGRPPLVQPGRSRVASAAYRPEAHSSTLQRFGGDGSFAVDPVQVGLVRSGGKPLPGPLLAKMEAALGADFSAVRIHVGPQASRIGALAFTTGNDLYFAPGQYQPDSVKGQQLIGHELAHVIQQRQGRVRAPGSGVAVVQDRALEAEADRLGMKAALASPLQRKSTVLTKSHMRRGPSVMQRMESDDVSMMEDEAPSPTNQGSPSHLMSEASEVSAANILLELKRAYAQRPAGDVQRFILGWLKANDTSTQPSNFSVGVTNSGRFIISKVGGITNKSAIIPELVGFIQSHGWGDRKFYLAGKFDQNLSSGNHAEMCVVAAAMASAEVGQLVSVRCTHPNCLLCATELANLGIAGGSDDDAEPGKQQTWAHPTKSLWLGTNYGETNMGTLAAALTAFDMHGHIPDKSCGAIPTTKPRGTISVLSTN